MAQQPVVIVGGGWAGIAAAIELTHHGVAVTLIDSGQRLGGRGRSVLLAGVEVDNGQHLLIGAYSETLRLMQRLGLKEHELFFRQPTLLDSRGFKLPGFRLSLPMAPAPFHFVLGLLRAEGFSSKEKFAILRFCARQKWRDFRLADDLPLGPWLTSQGQSDKVVQQLWKPLCLAILNTPIEIASTAIFLRVLRDSFTLKRGYSDFLVARHNLGKLLPEPAQAYLHTRQSSVVLGERIKQLEFDGDDGVRLHAAANSYWGKDVILALAPDQCLQLTASIGALTELNEKLSRFKPSPITTIYLQYPAHIGLRQSLLGISGGLLEWLVDRAYCDQPGLIAGVISGPGPHMLLSKEALIERALGELRCLFPHWPAPLSGAVIREKRATYLCEAGIHRLRPGPATALPRLWLAGDYTDTGYPATLEGAVRSGVACAQALMQHRSANAASSE